MLGSLKEVFDTSTEQQRIAILREGQVAELVEHDGILTQQSRSDRSGTPRALFVVWDATTPRSAITATKSR
jgi:hypothetical protein